MPFGTITFWCRKTVMARNHNVLAWNVWCGTTSGRNSFYERSRERDLAPESVVNTNIAIFTL